MAKKACGPRPILSTFLRGYSLKVTHHLFQLGAAAFGTLMFPGPVLGDGHDEAELLITLSASEFIGRHKGGTPFFWSLSPLTDGVYIFLKKHPLCQEGCGASA